jgi:hypothetical protein
MGDIDLVVLPTLLVCSFVSGFLLSCCPSRYNVRRVTELEDDCEHLEWQISKLQMQLEQATDKLASQESNENKTD